MGKNPADTKLFRDNLVPLLSELLFSPDIAVLDWHFETAAPPGSGLASDGAQFLTGHALVDGTETTWRLVLKVLRPPEGSRHDQDSRVESHWAYWRREHHAYTSDLLTGSHGLGRPRCLDIWELSDNEAIWLWLEACDGVHPSGKTALSTAARALGEFNESLMRVPSAPWLARGALRSRLVRLLREQPGSFADAGIWNDAKVLDVLGPGLQTMLGRLWRSHNTLLDRLDALRQTVVHGDANPANLFVPSPERGDVGVIAIDWANLGVAAIGTDLADLCVWSVLSGAGDGLLLETDFLLESYLAGLSTVELAADARVGFIVNAALMGAARLHWYVRRDLRAGVDPSTLEQWQPAAQFVHAFAQEAIRLE